MTNAPRGIDTKEDHFLQLQFVHEVEGVTMIGIMNNFCGGLPLGCRTNHIEACASLEGIYSTPVIFIHYKFCTGLSQHDVM